MPAITERTLSEADQAAVRSLYEPPDKLGTIEGRIQSSIGGNVVPVSAGHVWIEDLESGRVMAGSRTNAEGQFSLSGVPVGNYRALVEYVDLAPGDSGASTAASTLTTVELPTTVDRRSSLRQRAFRSVEIASKLRVTADKPTSLSYVLVPPQNSLPVLHPRFIGING